MSNFQFRVPSEMEYSQVAKRIPVQRAIRLFAIISWLGSTPWLGFADKPGEIDISFNPALEVDSEVNAIILLDDGKVLAGGFFTIPGRDGAQAVARFNPDGSLDASFAVASTDTPVLNIVRQGDGKIVIAGAFTQLNGDAKRYIARLNPDGSLDVSYHPLSINSPVTALDLQNDKVLLAQQQAGAIRLNPDGAHRPTDDQWTAGHKL